MGSPPGQSKDFVTVGPEGQNTKSLIGGLLHGSPRRLNPLTSYFLMMVWKFPYEISFGGFPLQTQPAVYEKEFPMGRLCLK